jgi:hypothetical protein
MLRSYRWTDLTTVLEKVEDFMRVSLFRLFPLQRYTIKVAVLSSLIEIVLSGVTLPAIPPIIEAVSITPTLIPASTPTTLSVTARISNPLLVPETVRLIALGPTGAQTTLTKLSELGASSHLYNGTYVARFAVGQTHLAVMAVFKEFGPVTSAQVPVVVLQVPEGFTVNAATLSAGGPVALTNFHGRYGSGGTLPGVGAAEITITQQALPPGSLNDFVQQELRDSTNVSEGNVLVSTVSCKQAIYRDTFTSLMQYANAATYCPTQHLEPIAE